MVNGVSSLPPGAVAEATTDDLQPYMTNPVRFLWQRYRQYGRIFTAQLDRPTIFMVGPEANKFILHDRKDCFSSGQTWPQAVRSLLGEEALSFHDGESYLRLLQFVSPSAFAPDVLHGAFESLKVCVDTHSQRWATGKPLAFHTEVRGLVNEAMFRWMMGTPDQPAEMDELKALYKAMTFIPEPREKQARSQDLPWTRHRPSVEEWQAKLDARDTLHCYLMSVVASRRHHPRCDALSRMCQKKDKAGLGLTDREAVSQMLNLMSAGTDASSAIATWLLSAVARFPEVRAKLQAETDTVVGDEPLQWHHLSQLPYTMGVLKEVERMHPPALAPVRVVVKPCQFDGYDVPEGAMVRYATIISHFLPEVFAHPETFDPERFAPPREEDKRTPYSLVGFGGGSRHCLGKPFAKIFLQTLLVMLLQHYDWTVVADRELAPERRDHVLKAQLKMAFTTRAAAHR
jgi:cytochrome P450